MGVLRTGRFQATTTRPLQPIPITPTPADLERMNRLRARYVQLLIFNPALAHWLMDWMDSLLTRNGV